MCCCIKCDVYKTVYNTYQYLFCVMALCHTPYFMLHVYTLWMIIGGADGTFCGKQNMDWIVLCILLFLPSFFVFYSLCNTFCSSIKKWTRVWVSILYSPRTTTELFLYLFDVRSDCNSTFVWAYHTHARTTHRSLFLSPLLLDSLFFAVRSILFHLHSFVWN